jgi:16S rRNA (cytidine1402-2'-O)-methyltransferase
VAEPPVAPLSVAPLPVALYVVATPIGNLGDLSARARDVLAAADVVAAEDTRRTRTLMIAVGRPDAPIRRLDEHATEPQIEALAEELSAGRSVAVVSDAGTPSVSDPGPAIVRAARARGVRVVPIPGPSAVVTALSASGYSASTFSFLGFLPRSGPLRTRALARVQGCEDAVVFFEAPPRMSETLRDLGRIQPARRAFVARELTKLHEEHLEGTLEELARSEATREWIGELTVVLAPFAAPTEALAEPEVVALVDAALARGDRPKDLAERLALDTGWSKRDLYQLALTRRAR